MLDRYARVRRYLEKIAPGGDPANLESVRKIREGQETTFESMPGSTNGVERLASTVESLVSQHEMLISPTDLDNFEAIILPRERPVWLVQDGTYPTVDWEGGRLEQPGVRQRLVSAILAVGRVDLDPAFPAPYAGTAFFVGSNLMMTNRHVAAIFSRGLGRTVQYRAGAASVDLLREADRTGVRRLTVDKVLMVHPYWDVALLEVSGETEGIGALTLSDLPAADAIGRYIAAIGYPARDPRNDIQIQNFVFQDRFEVKRLMPGKVLAPRSIQSFEQSVDALCHEASTLGGASGSAVIDVETGDVLALHFGGIYLDANFAVPAWALAADPRVRDLGVRVRSAVSAAGPWVARWASIEREGGQALVAPLQSPGSQRDAPSAAVEVDGGRAPTIRDAVTRELTLEIPIRLTLDVGATTVRDAVLPSPPRVAPPPAPVARTSEGPEPIDDGNARARFAETSDTAEYGESVQAPTEAPLLDRSKIVLIADDLSPSLRHVAAPLSEAPFELTAAVLERLVSLNHFGPGLLAWGGDLVLFGLRGCRLQGDPDAFPAERDLQPKLGFVTDKERSPDKLPLWFSTSGFVKRATLVEDTITHVLPRCLLGVWNRKTGEFALVRGTTTPNWDYSAQAIATRQDHDEKLGQANLLLPGLYRYAVGHHKGIPDAFRLASEDHGVVRPSATGKKEISYTVRDRFWWDSPSQDNMHPSSAGAPSATRYLFHYSAGCQTIQGSFDDAKQRHGGAWSVFRGWAGLKPHAVDTDAIGTRRFSYLLLTGREARLAANAATSDAALARLRYGSRGEAVNKLQAALAAALGKPKHQTGIFDGETQKRLVIWQWTKGANRDSADGVLAPTESATLGVPLIPTDEARAGTQEVFFLGAAAKPAPALCLPQEDPNATARVGRLEQARKTWRLGLWSYGDGEDTVQVAATPIPSEERPSLDWTRKLIPAIAKVALNDAGNRLAWTFRTPLEEATSPPTDHVTEKWRAAEERAEIASARLDTGGTVRSAAQAIGGDLVAEAEEGLAAVLGSGEIGAPVTSEEAFFSLAGPRGRPSHIEDYGTLFHALPREPAMELYLTRNSPLVGLSDEAFVRARLVGPNPEMLTCAASVPDGFSPNLKLPDGEKASAAAEQERLFLVDYGPLQALTPGQTRGVPKFLSLPRALFAVSKKTSQLVPVAISCDGTVYTPGGKGWTYAKHAVQVADGNYHELISHLALTHLLVEPFILATRRCLSDAHPLHRLLVPHFEGTIFINDQARGGVGGDGLIAKGGTIDQIFAGTIGSSQTLAVRSVAGFDFATGALPQRIEQRHLDKIADFPWRDDALRVNAAISDFVGKYLRKYYIDPAALAGDTELRAFCKAVSLVLPKFVAPATVEALIETVTLVVYTASAQHAAVNFPQYPEMSFSPLVAGSAWSNTVPETEDEDAMLAFFPPLDLAQKQAQVLYLLSSIHHTRLGQYPAGHFGDPAVDGGLVKDFQRDLAAIEAQITAANATRRWPYPHLLPSMIPQSINI
jgi:arachidonate 15-lipoxygenase